MALKKISLAGVVVCCGLYALFHKSKKPLVQQITGAWSSTSDSGTVTMDLHSNYLFDCDITEKRSSKRTHYKGHWDMNGKSINTETTNPVDAIFTATTNDNQQLFNHFVVEVDNHNLKLEKVGTTIIILFTR